MVRSDHRKPWPKLQRVGYSGFWVSRSNGAALTECEVNSIDAANSSNVPFQYDESEVQLFADPDSRPGFFNCAKQGDSLIGIEAQAMFWPSPLLVSVEYPSAALAMTLGPSRVAASNDQPINTTRRAHATPVQKTHLPTARQLAERQQFGSEHVHRGQGCDRQCRPARHKHESGRVRDGSQLRQCEQQQSEHLALSAATKICSCRQLAGNRALGFSHRLPGHRVAMGNSLRTKLQTSAGHPLYRAQLRTEAAGDLIGITFCHDRDDRSISGLVWRRDRDADLDVTGACSMPALVTLLGDHNFSMMQVPEPGASATVCCREWHHPPINEVQRPDERFE